MCPHLNGIRDLLFHRPALNPLGWAEQWLFLIVHFGVREPELLTPAFLPPWVTVRVVWSDRTGGLTGGLGARLPWFPACGCARGLTEPGPTQWEKPHRETGRC